MTLGSARVLAVVPARGGSKGLPRKNLRVVGGLTLVARVGDVVRSLPEIDRAVVSTDDDEIAAAAIAAGLAAPFRRPAALAGDRIGDVDVLEHALLTCEAHDGVTYDVVIMLQPTSPLRTPEDVRRCLVKLVEERLDSVWCVSRVPLHHHPLKQLRVEPDGALAYVDERGRAVVARQELAPTYVRNGAAYAITRACLVEQRALLGRRAGCVVLEEERVNIDDAADLERAEQLLRARATSAPSDPATSPSTSTSTSTSTATSATSPLPAPASAAQTPAAATTK